MTFCYLCTWVSIFYNYCIVHFSFYFRICWRCLQETKNICFHADPRIKIFNQNAWNIIPWQFVNDKWSEYFNLFPTGPKSFLKLLQFNRHAWNIIPWEFVNDERSEYFNLLPTGQTTSATTSPTTSPTTSKLFYHLNMIF